MSDIKLALQEYVATANNSEYGGNYDTINSKFPEFSDFDPELLKEYVATANNEEYAGDYDIINSKFPEFKLGKSTDPAVAEPIVGSENTAFNGEESSTELPQVTMKDVDQREAKAVELGQNH